MVKSRGVVRRDGCGLRTEPNDVGGERRCGISLGPWLRKQQRIQSLPQCLGLSAGIRVVRSKEIGEEANRRLLEERLDIGSQELSARSGERVEVEGREPHLAVSGSQAAYSLLDIGAAALRLLLLP